MHIEQIYTGCLSQGAYYIESNGEAAIIDPLREVQPYIAKAKAKGVEIKYIFETHFHADFVSGHIDLAKATGAPIIYGPLANPSFEAYIGKDNEEFHLGNVRIKLLHTPGHTMESTCYLLLDEVGKEHTLFSGDTLFIGDVGRPDLAQKAANVTQEELAGILYDSLRNKIMTLPNEVIVYPGHGAGSACGKNMSKETISTIGEQKLANYALRANMTREEFIKEVTDGLASPPAYFPMNVRLNKEGYESFDSILQRGGRPLRPGEFEVVANETSALILDTRSPQEFAKSFIPNSINIGLDGQFAPWVGALVPEGQQIILVTEKGREEEAVTRLSRVGFDQVIGFLEGSIDSWINSGKETDSIISIPATLFADTLKINKLLIYDVRREGEYKAEHVENSINTPLDSLNNYLETLPKDELIYLHCAGGYRSMIAASILKSRGWKNIIDVAGGYTAISKTDVPKTAFVCPSTFK